MTMPARVSLLTPPQTRQEQPCLEALYKWGGTDCPICRSRADEPAQQRHRRAVINAIWRDRQGR